MSTTAERPSCVASTTASLDRVVAGAEATVLHPAGGDQQHARRHLAGQLDRALARARASATPGRARPRATLARHAGRLGGGAQDQLGRARARVEVPGGALPEVAGAALAWRRAGSVASAPPRARRRPRRRAPPRATLPRRPRPRPPRWRASRRRPSSSRPWSALPRATMPVERRLEQRDDPVAVELARRPWPWRRAGRPCRTAGRRHRRRSTSASWRRA